MKYKLIKEYPGSPKLNTILTHKELQYCNWDEYYEPIVEKDYEILSLKNIDIITDLEGNDTINILLKQGCSIHSIKRLSDGEIFTIGDKIKGNMKSEGKISLFVITPNNKINVWRSTTIIPSETSELLNTIYKVKQPLFTTEDGVDIFDYSDSFYWIRKDTLKLCERMTLNTSHSVFFQYEPKKELYFSTKEKAEEYILMNKPCLSINEITNLTETNPPDWLNKELIKIVKSKI